MTSISASAIGYYGVGIEDSLDEAAKLRGRLVLHIAEQDGFCPPPARQRILEALGGKANVELYVYPGMDHAFARTGGAHYDKPSALMAHQRSMAALQRVIGPQFDYSALWDKHCEYEFGTRDVAATMATMPCTFSVPARLPPSCAPPSIRFVKRIPLRA